MQVTVLIFAVLCFHCHYVTGIFSIEKALREKYPGLCKQSWGSVLTNLPEFKHWCENKYCSILHQFEEHYVTPREFLRQLETANLTINNLQWDICYESAKTLREKIVEFEPRLHKADVEHVLFQTSSLCDSGQTVFVNLTQRENETTFVHRYDWRKIGNIPSCSLGRKVDVVNKNYFFICIGVGVLLFAFSFILVACRVSSAKKAEKRRDQYNLVIRGECEQTTEL